MSKQNQWLFEAPYSMDAMAASPFQSIRGGIKGRVRRDISRWPSLLKRAIEEIQKAIRYLENPIHKDFDVALSHAEAFLKSAMQEVRKVMSGSRQDKVLDKLGDASVRVRAVRSQVRDKSILRKGGTEYCQKLLAGAIGDIQQAQRDVGLQQY